MRLTPRASADRVEGVVDGALKVRVTAAPVDGAANDALVGVLAESLGAPRRSIRLISGAANRRKVIEIEGADGPALRARWPGLDV